MSQVLPSAAALLFNQSATQNLQNKPELSLIAATQKHSARRRIETFIANGFATRYDAHITSFMPVLFALETSGVKAAVGTRLGAQNKQHYPFFIEQYLSTSIEAVLAQQFIKVDRAQIAEVGNLFSSASRYTLPLLFSLFFMLKQCGSKYLVFSATSQLKSLLCGAGLELIPLAQAEMSKLTTSNDDWGTYYETAPEVTALSLEQVTRHIAHYPKLNAHYQYAIGLIAKNVNSAGKSPCIQMDDKEIANVA